MLIYELPIVLIVGGGWLYGLFKVKTTRATAIAFFLMLLAVGGFHHLIFSCIEVMPGAKGSYIPIGVNWLKHIFFGLFLVGGCILVFPKSGKVLVPASFISLVLYSFVYLQPTGCRSSENRSIAMVFPSRCLIAMSVYGITWRFSLTLMGEPVWLLFWF